MNQTIKEQVEQLAAKFNLTSEAKSAVLELCKMAYIKGADSAWLILTEKNAKRTKI